MQVDMFRFVVVDMPQVGAATLAVLLAALLYMIYRDLRMLVQMVVDLKEEVMISRMATSAGEDFDNESRTSVSHASSDEGRCEGGVCETVRDKSASDATPCKDGTSSADESRDKGDNQGDGCIGTDKSDKGDKSDRSRPSVAS